jgi:hypothetical protein
MKYRLLLSLRGMGSLFMLSMRVMRSRLMLSMHGMRYRLYAEYARNEVSD